MKGSNLGNFLKSLLFSWVAIVFGTSMLIAAFAPIPIKQYQAQPVLNYLQQCWEIADEMGPVVKLSIIALFSVLIYLFKNYTLRHHNLLAYVTAVVIAISTILIVLAFLPASYSRGYGIGLTGTRFDMAMLPYYLSGALLGGIVFPFSYFTFGKIKLRHKKTQP